MATNKSPMATWLQDVPTDQFFWCQDGRAIKNLEELSLALRDMSSETFRHHVNNQKNDFSNWIRDVIGDLTLARQVQKATDSTTTARRVGARLSWLRKRS